MIEVTHPNEYSTIIQADVMDGLGTLASGSVHCTNSSLPYWGLRDYGLPPRIWRSVSYVPVAGTVPIVVPEMTCCLGLEPTPETFIGHLIDVFREVHRVLRDDGVLFVNLGDCFATGAGSVGECPGGGAQGDAWNGHRGSRGGSKKQRHTGAAVGPLIQPNRMPIGIPAGNLVGIPSRFAMAMQADGWILRQVITWAKVSPMPESIFGWRWVRCRIKVGSSERASDKKGDERTGQKPHGDRDGADFASQAKYSPCPGCSKCSPNDGWILRKGSWRPTTSSEPIFMFVKSYRYFCDGDGSKEDAVGGTPGNKTHKGKAAYESGDKHMRTKVGLCDMGPVENRNMRSVWSAGGRMFRLRDDLTPEQRQMVLGRLAGRVD